MKQILTAGVIALGIHGLLFCFNFKWHESLSLERPKSRVLNMTLTSSPMKTTPKPALEEKKPLIKKSTIVKRSLKQLKHTKHEHIMKAPPRKTIQIPVQPKINTTPKANTENTGETEKSDFKPEQNASKEVSKKNEQSALIPSPANVIHEARPIYRSNPPPVYPRIARIRGYQGDVMLDVLVNKNGTVGDLKVIKSSGYPILDRAAKSSVKNWLFEPGMAGKEKLKMWVRVPIRFELK